MRERKTGYTHHSHAVQLVDSSSFDSLDSLDSLELSEAEDNLRLRNALICTEGDVGVPGEGLPERKVSILSSDSGSAAGSAIRVDDDERERRIYGRGGGLSTCGDAGSGSMSGAISAPKSSRRTARGGGRSTIASSSCSHSR